jgi:hypothetical protein
MFKRGLSEVVSTMVLIVLVVAAVAIVGGIVNSLVKDKIDSSESCFNVGDKLQINNEFSCIEGGDLKLSLKFGDIDLDRIIISISGDDSSKKFEISNYSSEEIKMYNDPNAVVTLPPKNSGRTYLISLNGMKINQVKIAPTINNNDCEITDILSDIKDCSLYN